MNNFNKRYAITFGETAILHAGSSEIGSIREHGFSVEELKKIKEKIKHKSELIILSNILPQNIQKENEAATLIIRDGVNLLLGSDKTKKLLKEQSNIEYDKKYFDKRRNKTLNKRARYNIVFGDEEVIHSDDYKKFSIVPFTKLKYLNKIRKNLINILGEKAKNLNAEGNYYFDNKCGIGFHGDSERKIVICLSLGESSIIRYNWRMAGSSERYGSNIDLKINNGDIYIMSEKATGFDWKKRSKVRIVHAAGSEKYIGK